MILGIDPDTKQTGLAIADASTVYSVAIAEAKSKRTAAAAMEMADAVFYAIQEMYLELSEAQRAAFSGNIVLEGQKIYVAKSQARHNDIVRLALFAGFIGHSALAAVSDIFYNGRGEPSAGGGEKEYGLLVPMPQEWKGSVPKAIHQGRIYSRLGWAYKRVGKGPSTGYAYPTNPQQHLPSAPTTKTPWKHIGDAIGLAMWGSDKT